jgi:hypothetical protein
MAACLPERVVWWSSFDTTEHHVRTLRSLLASQLGVFTGYHQRNVAICARQGADPGPAYTVGISSVGHI